MADSDDDGPLVPIVCSDCETTTRVGLDDVADAVRRHNDQVHDGEEIAEVDPVLVDRIADLVADDMGLFDDEEA